MKISTLRTLMAARFNISLSLLIHSSLPHVTISTLRTLTAARFNVSLSLLIHSGLGLCDNQYTPHSHSSKI